jgi:hypothetical protein
MTGSPDSRSSANRDEISDKDSCWQSRRRSFLQLFSNSTPNQIVFVSIAGRENHSRTKSTDGKLSRSGRRCLRMPSRSAGSRVMATDEVGSRGRHATNCLLPRNVLARCAVATKAVEYKASRALFDLTRHRESDSYSDQKSSPT